MPVRIYDIAKKLGIESKEVLAKAKELGIAAAQVASSSLDKITAEYLEEQLGGSRVSKPSAPRRRRSCQSQSPSTAPPPGAAARHRAAEVRPALPSCRGNACGTCRGNRHRRHAPELRLRFRAKPTHRHANRAEPEAERLLRPAAGQAPRHRQPPLHRCDRKWATKLALFNCRRSPAA